jgi:radical SAM superfamily enzyme YgiQ (UPF0313 family)
MELPFRASGDELLKAGELCDIRRRLRILAGRHDLASVVACAFDHRTRMLPFLYADTHMVPAGVRDVGAALLDSGFEKTRIVLQQWNKKFTPSRMQIDGRMPDLFLISSMQLHWEPCKQMIRDACSIDEAHRPLIIVGGPKTIYEPWDVFGLDPADPWSADAAVTGESYILLQLLETLLTERAGTETIRNTFLRLRDSGSLDDILGLVYARGKGMIAEELVDTGIQRLAGNLDELAPTTLGYRLLEPPSRKATLGSQPVAADRIRKLTPLSSVVLTQGCKFRCQYCPIPAYNQRQYRTKSGDRIVEELTQLIQDYGLHFFFGTDDNFFNSEERTMEIVEKMVAAEVNGKPLRRSVRLATEATVHDTLKMKDHLPMIRKAGIRALWIGVEDMSGALVRKGQGEDETTKAFGLLRDQDICAMPMMMHHDDQPLMTRGTNAGLLNQIRQLQKAGASSLQVLMITPSPGSKLYIPTHTSGMVFESVGGKVAEPYLTDGNYVVASKLDRPWRKQFNILLAYLWFYNPIRMLWLACKVKNRLWGMDVGMQVFGSLGVLQNIRRTFFWGIRLMVGKITRRLKPLSNRIKMRAPDGGRAAHDLAQAVADADAADEQ